MSRPLVHAAAVAVLVSMSAGLSADSMEAILQPKTIEGFTRYAAAVESRIDRELRDNRSLPRHRAPAADAVAEDDGGAATG